MKGNRLLLCTTLLPLAFAQPAHADGGVLTAQLAYTVAKYTLEFISAASSNAVVEVHATAVSKVGETSTENHDTGFKWAEATTTATNGDLAMQTSWGYAQYNFISENVEKVKYTPELLQQPDARANRGLAVTKIKGVLQVLKETFTAPQIDFVQSPERFGEIGVPIQFDFELDGYSSYNFNVMLTSEAGDSILIASGTAGVGGASIDMPYLAATNPALAAAVKSDYLSKVSGRGIAAFTLGDGLLPDSGNGLAGIVVTYALDTPFSLDSDFGGERARTVPEPASWAMMITGFGFIGGCLRYRRNASVNA